MSELNYWKGLEVMTLNIKKPHIWVSKCHPPIKNPGLLGKEADPSVRAKGSTRWAWNILLSQERHAQQKRETCSRDTGTNPNANGQSRNNLSNKINNQYFSKVSMSWKVRKEWRNCHRRRLRRKIISLNAGSQTESWNRNRRYWKQRQTQIRFMVC